MKITLKTLTEYFGVVSTAFGLAMTGYGLHLQKSAFALQSHQSQPFFDVIYYETTQVGWSWELDKQSSELNLNPEDIHVRIPFGGQYFQGEKIFVLESPLIDVDVPTSCDILQWGEAELPATAKDSLETLCEQDAPIADALSTVITGIALSNNTSVNISNIKMKFERYELNRADPITFKGVSELYAKLAALPSEEVVLELPMIPNQGNNIFNQIYVPMFWYFQSTQSVALSEIYLPISVEFYNTQTRQTEVQRFRLMYSDVMSINSFVDIRG